ncbi:MAG TPA: PLDc N-terminal domain-containing protein, partial [Tissierellaceae bacterium]|nr:PLDc N-terminal domain-containing protein [Tissierellaceae bacterium]
MDVLIENYQIIFSNLLWINIILGIILVFFERRNPTSTWLWLMVLTFLPGIGFILYLFLGQDLSKQRMFKVKEIDDDCFRDLAVEQKEAIQNNEFHHKDPNFSNYEEMVKMFLMNSEAFFTQDNDVELYFDGKDKFEALLDSIKKAENYIYIQYYIFKN